MGEAGIEADLDEIYRGIEQAEAAAKRQAVSPGKPFLGSLLPRVCAAHLGTCGRRTQHRSSCLHRLPIYRCMGIDL